MKNKKVHYEAESLGKFTACGFPYCDGCGVTREFITINITKVTCESCKRTLSYKFPSREELLWEEE